MNLYHVPACHFKEVLNLYLNNDAQISQLWKEKSLGQILGMLMRAFHKFTGAH